MRGRAQRNADDEVEAEATVEVAVAANVTPTPTPPLPAVSGADESLKTIGGLGGALTIGRPSSIELHYAATETVIALPIDPSKPTTRGELRFNEAVMASDNPVAVWLFGTVLNYGIGLPDNLIRNLKHSDRIVINTDTGSSLRFIVSRQWRGANHESSQLLSQDRTGVTLFALPAAREDDVAFAFASYDVASEDALSQPLFSVGESFALAGGTFTVDEPIFSQTERGTTTVVLTGTTSLSDSVPIMLSLSTSAAQTAAIPLEIANGRWTATLPLSATSTRLPLFAEVRVLPSQLVVVQLGAVPSLHDLLEVEVVEAVWQTDVQRVQVTLSLHNPTAGQIYLPAGFIQYPQGGGVYSTDVQVTPYLPTLLNAGQAMGMQVSLPPHHTLQLQIGADLWDITGLPEALFSAETTTSTATAADTTTDR